MPRAVGVRFSAQPGCRARAVKAPTRPIEGGSTLRTTVFCGVVPLKFIKQGWLSGPEQSTGHRPQSDLYWPGLASLRGQGLWTWNGRRIKGYILDSNVAHVAWTFAGQKTFGFPASVNCVRDGLSEPIGGLYLARKNSIQSDHRRVHITGRVLPPPACGAQMHERTGRRVVNQVQACHSRPSESLTPNATGPKQNQTDADS